jgi:CHAT domain-containing protein/tetratricopeptide (TPR) repeat protein
MRSHLACIFVIIVLAFCWQPALPVQASDPSSQLCKGLDPAQLPPDLRTQSAEEAALADSLWLRAKTLQDEGSYRAAEPLWQKSVSLAEATWGPKHPVFAARLGDLGVNLWHQGKYKDADDLLRRALDIDKRRLGKRHPRSLDDLNNLAADIDDAGDYEVAESMYREALDLSTAKCGLNPAYILGNLAYNLLNQGRYREGEALFQRVLSLDAASSAATEQDIATDYSNIASGFEKLGRFVDAEKMYRRAIAADQKVLGKNHPEVAADFNNLAFALDHQSKLKEAERLHRQAVTIDIASVGASHPDTGGAESGLGQNLLQQKRYEEASAILAEALASQSSVLGPNHLDALLTATSLGESEFALGRLDQALKIGRQVIRAQSSMRISARASESVDHRARINGLSGNAAALVTRSAWKLARTLPPKDVSSLRAEAFESAQIVRTSPAADALGRSAIRAVASQAGAAREADQWQQAQDVLVRIDSQISEAANMGQAGDARRTSMQSQRAQVVTEVSFAERALKTRFPRFFDLLKMEPVAVRELQDGHLLRPDEALIVISADSPEPWASKNRGLIFAVTTTGVAWAEIGQSMGALQRSVDSLHEQLASGGATRTVDGPDPGPGFDRQASYALFQDLFGNSSIKDLISSKRTWILVPQGPLMSLPFAALVTDAPRGGVAGNTEPASLRTTHWLGLQHTLTYTPSVATLRIQRLFPRMEGRRSVTPFFGVGDPAFSGRNDLSSKRGSRSNTVRPLDTYFNGQVADFDELAKLPRLEGSGEEVRRLARLYHVKSRAYLLQLRATEAAVRQADRSRTMANARVVIFATHGLLAGQLQDTIAEPSLALTPPIVSGRKRPSSSNDGLLTSSEAAQLHFTADWLVLSACNTAAPDGGSTESLTGLARAFLYAGAKSMLVTHYPVFDDAAEFLTTETVRLTEEKKVTNPEALRMAIATLISDPKQDGAGRSYAHPSAWAAFMIIDGR